MRILKFWWLKYDIILESRDEFIKVKFYDSRNISELNQILILTVIQEFLFVIIRKYKWVQDRSEQQKSQNIESDLASIFIYLLYAIHELWSWNEIWFYKTMSSYFLKSKESL